MRNTIRLAILFIGTMTSLSLMANQIDSFNRNSMTLPIPGKVTAPDPLELAVLRVQLLDLATRQLVHEAPLSVGGAFQIPPIPIGFYELRIVGSTDEVKYSRELHSATTSSVNIVLPGKPGASGAQMVSASRLMHRTPKRVQKEIDQAAKAMEKNDRGKAIEWLLKAAIEDPENFDVVSNIGALYLQQKEPEKAFEWLSRAQKIDPSDSVNNVNLAAYYANVGEFEKAESLAASSLRQDPNSVRGRFVLAFAMLKQGKNTEQARTHLDQIQDKFLPAKNLLRALSPME